MTAMTRRFTIILLTTALLTACDGRSKAKISAQRKNSAQTQDLQIPEDAPTVLFFGDSITAGLHVDSHQAFPALLQHKLAGTGLPFQLVTAGISGDTSAGGLARIDWSLKAKPQIVVVELGGNDALRGQNLGAVKRNLEGIVRKIKRKGIAVLLLGMRIPPSYGRDYSMAFEALYQDLAKAENLTFIPFFMADVAGVPDLNHPDGLHPNPAGHQKLAEKIAPFLIEMLGDD